MKHTFPFVALLVAGCTGSEAVPMTLEVATAADRIQATDTDLGYQVALDRIRIAVRDIQFTTDGETEMSLASRAKNWLIGTAHAHPGHAGGGEVIGELAGDRILEWSDRGFALGSGTLLTGDYTGSNFLFRAASADDGLDASDPLVGHAIHIEATVTRGADSWTLTALLQTEPDTALVGAPFEASITSETTPDIALLFAPTDPFEGDTAFDGIDFATLDADSDGIIEINPGDAAHNILRRALTSHDHYLVEARP